MKPPSKTYAESLSQVRQELIEFLRGHTPAEAASDLEKSGWTREWACTAVETIEYRHNPARLSPDARGSQATREKLQSRAALGAGVFVVGLVISIGTLVVALSAGGWIIVTYGAVITGAGMWLDAYSKLKRYPDRPIPRYVPPRDKRVHDPGSY